MSAGNGDVMVKLDNGQHFIRIHSAGNFKLDKEKSTEKTDGAVATIILLH